LDAFDTAQDGVAFQLDTLFVCVHLFFRARIKSDQVKAAMIPKIIWTYWDDVEMSPVVKYCIDTWKIHNPTYKIVVLNKANLREFVSVDIDRLKHSHDSPARYSDFVRLCVLADHGGIWMDASTLCNAPLDWANTLQTQKNVEFVGYHLADYTVDASSPVIESYFLACISKSWFMQAWKAEFLRSNLYATPKAYLESVDRLRVHYKSIADPEYLLIHVSAQVVLQSSILNKNNYVFTTSAEKTPYAYLVDHKWDSTAAVDALCNNPKYRQYPIIKLRSHERRRLEQSKKCVQLF
jgi:hypothetical protein